MRLIDGKWINWTELLSWGSLITESIADRDVGKSYGMLKRCMVRARKHGEAMVWLVAPTMKRKPFARLGATLK